MTTQRSGAGHIFMVCLAWLVAGITIGVLGAYAFGINEFGSYGVIAWGVILGVLASLVHAVVIYRRTKGRVQ